MDAINWNHNPLDRIYYIFPKKEPSLLTLQQMELVKKELKLSGINCETPTEIIECLGLLALTGTLSIKVNKNNTVLIGNNYNGK
jgi:hypothetical protein